VSYYPIYLEMNGRRCVVVGGGTVAERKVEALLEAGAAVTVITPVLTELLKRWVDERRISHAAKSYAPGDIAGYELAFVATDDPTLNAVVYEEGRNHGLWVNAADDVAHCDFILPAVIRRGDLAVAISTGGASPAATRAIREELDQYFTLDYAEFVQIASEVRQELRTKFLYVSADRWNKALKGNFRRLIREGRAEQAKVLLLETLGAKS
jgi:precorrin-2 dehydrogenase / sirohydrochlorin ferrochelatase